MNRETGSFSPEEFSSTAESFGYRYTDLAFSSSVGGRGTPVFEGVLGLQSLPCGISLCASDLRSLHDSEHQGTVDRSLTIAVVLDRVAGDCTLALDNSLSIESQCASLVSVADKTLLTGRYKAGERSRCLLIRTTPEDVSDDVVAEQIEVLLRSTSVKRLPMSYRAMSFVEELLAPTSQGAVGRLLAESCALELLARALLKNAEEADPLAAGLSKRDHAKILRVRDMLLSDPGRNFTLGELALEAGMSMTLLKARFSTVFGQSVFSFLREVRLHHAKEGIEKEGWTVSQAAHFVGYRHHSNFSTAFRRRYGVPPKQFRKS